MPKYKITWVQDLFEKVFHKPKLSGTRSRVTTAKHKNSLFVPSNGAKKGTNGTANEGTETSVPGTHHRVASSLSSPSNTPPVDAKSIFKEIKIKSFSVLGELGYNYQTTTKGEKVWGRTYEKIDKDLIYKDAAQSIIDYSHTALVDAGGLNYFIDKTNNPPKGTGPKGAGLSSGELYKFIGITDKNYFTTNPNDILDTIKGIGDAKLISYEPKYTRKPNVFHIIHAVGPDLRKSAEEIKSQINPKLYLTDPDKLKSFKLNMQDVIDLLSKLYKNIFVQFITNKKSKNLVALHIAPISAGSFAGTILSHKTQKAKATMTSIFNALNVLSEEQLNELKDIKILLCIWKGGDITLSDSASGHYKTQQNTLSTSAGGYLKSSSIKKKIKKRTFRKNLKKFR